MPCLRNWTVHACHTTGTLECFSYFVVWQKLFEDLLSIFKKAYIIDLSQVKLNFLLPVPEMRGDGL